MLFFWDIEVTKTLSYPYIRSELSSQARPCSSTVLGKPHTDLWAGGENEGNPPMSSALGFLLLEKWGRVHQKSVECVCWGQEWLPSLKYSFAGFLYPKYKVTPVVF